MARQISLPATPSEANRWWRSRKWVGRLKSLRQVIKGVRFGVIKLKSWSEEDTLDWVSRGLKPRRTEERDDDKPAIKESSIRSGLLR